MDAIQALRLDLAAARLYANVTERAWGLLYHNEENKLHHDANCARIIRTIDPEPALGEIVAFYQARGIVPRVKVDEMTAPPDLVERLKARGFQSHLSECRVMVWGGVLPEAGALPPGASLAEATAADRPALGAIRSDANESDSDWIDRQLRYEMQHPGVRHFIALMDGRPAACAAAISLLDWVIVEHVATARRFQRQGLASALVRKILAEVPGQKMLFVADEGAERVYNRMDFHVTCSLQETVCWLDSEEGQ